MQKINKSYSDFEIAIYQNFFNYKAIELGKKKPELVLSFQGEAP